MDDVVNCFNNFFVNVGPNLAGKIPHLFSFKDWNENHIDRNPSSMFITAVEEKKIIGIVNKHKYKTSADCNDIDMKNCEKGHWRDFRTTYIYLKCVIPNWFISKQNENRKSCAAV